MCHGLSYAINVVSGITAKISHAATLPNKAVESDGDKRVLFGLRDLSRRLRSSHRASSLASLTVSPPRLTADVRQQKMNAIVGITLIIAMFAICLGGAIYVYRSKGSNLPKVILTLVLVAAIPATYYMSTTFRYDWNGNTYALGWPIPIVVFQRHGPNEPWFDFIGPTLYLAYPMNYLFYTWLPILFLALAVAHSRRLRKDQLRKR